MYIFIVIALDEGVILVQFISQCDQVRRKGKDNINVNVKGFIDKLMFFITQWNPIILLSILEIIMYSYFSDSKPFHLADVFLLVLSFYTECDSRTAQVWRQGVL